jgi:hypothetical protein
MFAGKARVRVVPGRVLRKQPFCALAAGQSVVRQGTIWRHSQRVRVRWQRAISDLRRVEVLGWCDAAVQTFRF